MSDRATRNRVRHLCAALALAGCLGWMQSAGAGNVSAAAREAKSRTPAGRCVSVSGPFLRREASDKDWQRVAPKETVSSRELLLALPGSRAEIDSKNAAVRLTLAGNLPELSLVPLLESAVVLNSGKEFDLDFTLHRGRVILANRKAKGKARVRVTFQGQAWELTLSRPGSEVALELIARWVEVPSSMDKPKKGEKPLTSLFLFALKESAEVTVDEHDYFLRAPAGPALLAWRGGRVVGPTRLKELPPWARPQASRTPPAKSALLRVQRLDRAIEKTDVSASLAETLQSTEAPTRGLAVFSLGAVDDLPTLLKALEDSKHRDVRLTAIDAVRHWLGRSAESPTELALTMRANGFTAPHSRIVMRLLYSFSRRQTSQPETYEVLIEYLKHQRLAIRELAYWHLSRLAPEEARKVKYNPAGDTRSLQLAYKQWKRELPDGKLPRKPKPLPKDKQ